MLRHLVVLAVSVVIIASTVSAASVTFNGSSGTLAASAKFDTSGSNLLVTLANTSTADVLVPADVLTAVYFDIAGNPTLGRVSAILTPGSTVLFPESGTGTDPVIPNGVGGEWAYAKGLSVATGVGTQGISSAGLGLFGPSDRFPGVDLQNPEEPDGLQYGLISPVDDPANGNTPVTGKYALIKSSVDFVLSGLPSGFDPSTGISNVYFQYGTALDEPRIPSGPPDVNRPPDAVPEPITMAGVFMGVTCVGGYIRRRMNKR